MLGDRADERPPISKVAVRSRLTDSRRASDPAKGKCCGPFFAKQVNRSTNECVLQVSVMVGPSLGRSGALGGHETKSKLTPLT